MKKSTLLLLVLMLGAFSSFSQISINLVGETTDYSGSVYSYYALDTNYHAHSLEVHNNTGVTKNWVITRVRIDPPATWEDYLCWGHQSDPFGGTCIPASSMDMDYYQMAPSDQVTINDGEYGILLVDHKPSAIPSGTYTYRYYVGAPQGAFEDSVDVQVIITDAGINDLTNAFELQMAPNPTTNIVTVQAESVQFGTLQVADLSGNTIQIQDFSSNATIDVSTWKPGIYFVILTSESGTKRSEKLVVQ